MFDMIQLLTDRSCKKKLFKALSRYFPDFISSLIVYIMSLSKRTNSGIFKRLKLLQFLAFIEQIVKNGKINELTQLGCYELLRLQNIINLIIPMFLKLT